MPVLPPNFENFRGKKVSGRGSEVKGYKDEKNFVAFHIDGNKKRNFSEINRLKITFYNQKILHELFPENFPNFSAAGKISSHVGYTIRDFNDANKLKGFVGNIKYLLNPMGNSSQLAQLKQKFAEHNLFLRIDRINPQNIGIKDNEEVYLDTNRYIIRTENDLKNLIKLATELGLSQIQINRIYTWANRILEIVQG